MARVQLWSWRTMTETADTDDAKTTHVAARLASPPCPLHHFQRRYSRKLGRWDWVHPRSYLTFLFPLAESLRVISHSLEA